MEKKSIARDRIGHVTCMAYGLKGSHNFWQFVKTHKKVVLEESQV